MDPNKLRRLDSDILRKSLAFFKKNGIDFTKEQLVGILEIDEETFNKIGTKDDLFMYAVLHEMSDNRVKQNEIIQKNSNPVNQIMELLKFTLNNSKELNPKYIQAFTTFPELWREVEKEIDSYSIPLYHRMLNEGIVKGYFRKDINIDIVTKVIIGNLSVLLNFRLFPPVQYRTEEVVRSIYLYYFRGLCEPAGMKVVDEFFAS